VIDQGLVIDPPPSTTMFAPLMNEASSEARNRSTAAISSGSPDWPRGVGHRRQQRVRRIDERLRCLGPHQARADADRANVVWAARDGEMLRKVDHAGLGRPVHGMPGEGRSPHP
jgi:hypothetical protein